MAIRKIVKIDQDKCNGCGLCVPNCVEGALAIVSGKARLVKDSYCDGLGACLGECPQGAITVEERDAAEFDEAAALAHVATQGVQAPAAAAAHGSPGGHGAAGGHGGGCPGSRMMQFRKAAGPGAAGAATGGPAAETGAAAAPAESSAGAAQVGSELGHWPVQLALVPVQAPFYQDTELVLAADCAAYACGDFHRRFLKGRALAIACPKLDDMEPYVAKLAEILRQNAVRGLVIVHMEVPCCGGIVRLAREAARQCGRPVPVRDVIISVDGQVIRDDLAVFGG